MNYPAVLDIPREQLWLIACVLTIEIDDVQAGNYSLRAKLPQAHETIQSL